MAMKHGKTIQYNTLPQPNRLNFSNEQFNKNAKWG